MTIKICIERGTLEHLRSDVNVGVLAVARLKQAGAPVVGPLWPKPTRGILLTYVDEMFEDLIFEWREDV